MKQIWTGEEVVGVIDYNDLEETHLFKFGELYYTILQDRKTKEYILGWCDETDFDNVFSHKER